MRRDLGMRSLAMVRTSIIDAAKEAYAENKVDAVFCIFETSYIFGGLGVVL